MNTQTHKTPQPAPTMNSETRKNPETPDMTTTSDSEDRDALVHRYVEDNQGLVRMVARRLSYQYGEEFDPETREDLYNECLQNGVFGLRRAAELYDATRGSFSNYACRWIFKRAKEAADAWMEDRRHTSLDAPMGEEDSSTMGDMVADERAEVPSDLVDRMQRVEAVRTLLNDLPARDRAMVEMHYGLHDGHPAPFAEIGVAFNVSTQRAERIVKRALERMRAGARGRGIDPAA